jgi:iron complex outermembrane receptor protein
MIIPSVQANPEPSLPSNLPTKLRDLKQPARTVKEWLAQVEAMTVPVTGVTLERTAAGLDITLETAEGKPLQVDATKFRAEGKSLIADIPNAVLALPNAQEFSADNPTVEIATVRVTQTDASTIRVSVVGTTALPKSEVTLKVGGLAYSLNPEGETPEEELVVTGEGQRGYRVPNATTATKTDTPLRDVPASIQVIPRQLIEDRQSDRLGDALRNVSGIQQPNVGSRNNFDIFFIRGFSSGNEGVLRDGLRDRTNSRVLTDTISLERIEVLKGPVAALYGQGGLGGTINLVTKQPLSQPFYSISASAASFDFYRGTLDFTGPLNSDRTLLYRFTAAAQTTGSFGDFVESQQYFVSPSLAWQIGKNTKLTVNLEYTAAPRRDDFGIPAVGTILRNPNGRISRKLFIGEPDDADNRYALRVSSNLEHRFSDNWQIRSAFRGTFYRANQPEVFPGALSANGRFLTRTFSEPGDLNDTNDYALDTYVVGKVATGSVLHQLVFGVDLFKEYNRFNGQTRAIAPIDLFNPVYGSPLGAVLSRSDSKTERKALGIYLQDQITLADNLKLLLGGRFDILNQEDNNFVRATESFQQNEAFSPRVGIVYQPIQPLSLYASYGRSITQVVGTTFDTGLFEPERGTQYEVGIKADLSSRMSAILAFYDLTRKNVTTPDPRDIRFSVQTGEQRSRGIEFDLSGEILPGWNIFASAAYTDAEVIADNTFRVGNSLALIPKFSASLWTTYEIQKGNLRGLGFGLGLYYVGDRQGDLANTFEIPNYLRTDAAIFYKRDRLRVSLNIRNLFDITYFESALSRVGVLYGDPLTVQGTISFTF